MQIYNKLLPLFQTPGFSLYAGPYHHSPSRSGTLSILRTIYLLISGRTAAHFLLKITVACALDITAMLVPVKSLNIVRDLL